MSTTTRARTTGTATSSRTGSLLVHRRGRRGSRQPTGHRGLRDLHRPASSTSPSSRSVTRAVLPDQRVPGEPGGVADRGAVRLEQRDLVRLLEPEGVGAVHRGVEDVGRGLEHGEVQPRVELVEAQHSVLVGPPAHRDHPPVGRDLDAVGVTQLGGDRHDEAHHRRCLRQGHAVVPPWAVSGRPPVPAGAAPLHPDAAEAEPVRDRRAHRRGRQQREQDHADRERDQSASRPGWRHPRGGRVAQPLQDGGREARTGSRHVDGAAQRGQVARRGRRTRAQPPCATSLACTRSASASSRSRSRARARCSRDFTVPRGHPRTAAVSASSRSRR